MILFIIIKSIIISNSLVPLFSSFSTYVSIQGKQRFLGDAASAMARSNISNTVSTMKLLVGRRFDSPDVQAELAKAPFKVSSSTSSMMEIK